MPADPAHNARPVTATSRTKRPSHPPEDVGLFATVSFPAAAVTTPKL